MIIKEAVYMTSAVDKKGFISSEKPIIAICGKSNVGKSSLINMLAAQKKLARTSNTPGRTRMINYFDFGEFILADLPGYGFASVSKTEKDKWARTMEDFFAEKEKIAHCFSLLDGRHDPTKDDVTMINFLYQSTLPFSVIATKCDKISKSQVKNKIKSLANKIRLTENDIIAASAVDKKGKEEILKKIEKIIALFKGENLV